MDDLCNDELNLNVLLTFHMSDAAQGIFQSVERRRLAALVSLFRRQMTLQLFQSFKQLFLRLGLGGLFTTAGAQKTHAQICQKQNPFKTHHSLLMLNIIETDNMQCTVHIMFD